MRISFLISLFLHALLGAAIVYAWPSLMEEQIYTPLIPIDVIREAELADELSVPEEVKVEESEEDVPEPAAEEEVITEPETAPEEAPVEPEREDVPPPIETPEEDEPEVVEEEETPPEPVEEEQPVVVPPTEERDDTQREDDLSDLGSLLTDLEEEEDTRRPSEIRENESGGDRDVERQGEGLELTITEEQLIRARLEECWNLDAGARDAADLDVVVIVNLNRDGTIQRPIRVKNDGEINRSGNPYWIAARNRALQAVNRCEPYNYFDPGRYDAWKSFEFNFDPANL